MCYDCFGNLPANDIVQGVVVDISRIFASTTNHDHLCSHGTDNRCGLRGDIFILFHLTLRFFVR